MILSGFNDIIQLSKSISLIRLYNALKITVSYFLSNIRLKGLPISISIEPTNICNLNCPQCPSGSDSLNRKSGEMDMATFKSIIDQVYHTTPYLTLYFQGEPYLNKNFFDFIKYATKRKIYIASSTNGHFLNDQNARKTVESGLSRLIVSVDGTTQEVFEIYRKGGNLETVVEGTKRLIEWKKKLKSRTPYIIYQFLVLRSNEHQIDQMKKFANNLGVEKVSFKTAQIYDFKNGNELIPENQKYSRYKKEKDGTYSLKNKLSNHCWRTWSSCVITWDGDIIPCCFDKEVKYNMGNIRTTSFDKIWFGDTFTQFRSRIISNRKSIDICNNCTQGGKVWIKN